MPAYPRHEIVAPDEIGVYHCIARCVRKAFLCGFDSATGRDYEHRKDWICDRLQELASIFAIDICGYAVMSNHLHLVLRGRPDVVRNWSNDEVALRWKSLFPPRDPATGKPAEPSECDLNMILSNPERVAELRAKSRGTIPAELAPILERLGVKGDRWVDTVHRFGRWFKQVVGRCDSLKALAKRMGRSWFQGQRAAAVPFL